MDVKVILIGDIKEFVALLCASTADNLKLRVEFWGCRLNTWDVNFSCSVTPLAAGLSHSSAAVDFWCDAVVSKLKIDRWK